MENAGTIEHKKALQKSSNIKIGIGVLMILGGAVLMGAGAMSGNDGMAPLAILGLLIRLVGLVPWFWGLAEYSKSKGYSPVLAVLGIIFCIGLLILVILPDKYVIQTRQYDPNNPNSNYPR